MPKRKAEEHLSHYMSLILDLVPENDKEIAKKYFLELKDNIIPKQKDENNTVESPSSKVTRIIEEFEKSENRNPPPLPSVDCERSNMNTIEQCTKKLLDLNEHLKYHQQTIIQVSIAQGDIIRTIKKDFHKKTKDFKEYLPTVSISYSHALFLIRFNDFFLLYPGVYHSTLSLRFFVKHLTVLTEYYKCKKSQVLKCSFSTQPISPQPMSQ